MNLKLDRPAILGSLSCWDPDVKIEAIFVFEIGYRWRGRRIGEGCSGVPVGWLWAYWTEICIVPWTA
jgi:hypothetical protein